MRLPRWLHRRPDPDRTIAQRPTDVRLIDVHGQEFPVEVEYRGPDEAGVHVWAIVGGLPQAGEWAPPAPKLYVGTLPAMSSITFPGVPMNLSID